MRFSATSSSGTSTTTVRSASRDLIYPLRRAFPLTANQIQKTATVDGDAKESIAAMNVVDGRKLVEHIDKNNDAVYPFGVSTLPRRSAAEEAAITAAVTHIRDVNDAVADVVLSEGVYQAVTGNFDRSAGTLDAFAKGNYPVEPDVIRTPRSGTTLTLRTAIHLSPTGPAPVVPLTPLAIAEPNLNRWLETRLPLPDDVGCQVTFVNRTTGFEETVVVTQGQLGLTPIDLLYRLETRTDQALGDLDDRILEHIHATQTVRHDHSIVIRHTDRIPGRVTWFELEALLRSLRRVVVGTRPLRPSDLVRQGDATQTAEGTSTLPRARLHDAKTSLESVHQPALAALTTTIGNAAVNIDDAVTAFVQTVSALAAYRIPQAGTGFAYEWRARTYSALVDRVAALVATWDERLGRYEQLLLEQGVPGAASEERRQLLRTAEVLISTAVTSLSDAPSPDDHEAALMPKKAAFVAKKIALEQTADVARATLAQLMVDVEVVLPLDSFDPDPFDLGAERDEIDRFRAELTRRTADLSGRMSRPASPPPAMP